MGILNKILNSFIKFAFIVIGLSIAVVPVIYIFGHQSVSQQIWSSSLERFTGRARQVEKIKDYEVSNIYLRNNKTRLSWTDVNTTLELAKYLQHELEKQNVAVVKRIVEFKKPALNKKAKKGEQSQIVAVEESNQLKEVPPLRWFKDILEPYLAFEHQSLQRKHWLVVCLGQLDSKVVNEIESIKKANSLYKFIVVSTWPITSKILDIDLIPFEGEVQTSQIQAHNSQKEAEVEQDKKSNKGKAEQSNSKQVKDKKEKRFKVKQIKESKEEKPAQQPENANQPQEL